ncbi:hypothetical protein N657DRAFT_572047 [Parathielavia appendiculata]|uniref:Uncharacterized protein n=1 Tax=Parathielavia appendiculata TaxID=2587402 RepID=A0AAN6U1U2_9PEZI|nr:hypothetical protein N657DRAFT_572047 [Parathielavia appendiculata]
MAPAGSQAVFDSLLAKTHVQHALVQGDGRRNEVPAVPDEETKAQFQRAFMTYFSIENGRFAGNTKALALTHIFTGDKPLLQGLFSGIGQPLTLLSDGIELRNSILVMQALTLSAVDWMEPISELLMANNPHTSSTTSAPPRFPRRSERHLALPLLSPEEILHQLAYDGRLSGVIKSGPGFHPQAVSHILSNPAARAAVAEYVDRLDTSDPRLVLSQLAALSTLLTCATHKPGQAAFDVYLSRLPTCVHSALVVMESWVDDAGQRESLVRGLWLVVVLVYVTQLRPVVDGRLLVSKELAEERRGWEEMMEEVRGRVAGLEEGEEGGGDWRFWRMLRSLREFSKVYGVVHGRLYFHAAWKLVGQWQGWTGLGDDREVMLNIRL